MNRRIFISMLAGAAGAPLVPWRHVIEPIIVLPQRAAWSLPFESLDDLPDGAPYNRLEVVRAEVGQSHKTIYDLLEIGDVVTITESGGYRALYRVEYIEHTKNEFARSGVRFLRTRGKSSRA